MAEQVSKISPEKHGELQGPPKPRDLLLRNQLPWITSQKFLEFLFSSLRPDNNYLLPLTITKNQLSYFVNIWNKKHPGDAVKQNSSVFQAPNIEDLSNRVSLLTAIEQYRRMNPATNLNLATSDAASPTSPVFSPEVAQLKFKKWVAELYERGARGEAGLATEIRLRLLKGTLNKIDLDYLTDKYESKHPHEYLNRVEIPYEPKKVSELFPDVKLPQHTLSDKLVPIATVLLTGKEFKNLSAEQQKILSLIKRDIDGKTISASDRKVIEGPVRELAFLLPPNSPIVQLRIRHLNNSYAATRALDCEIRAREQKGESTERDAKLKIWIPTRLKQIEEQYKALPQGANSFRLYQARLNEEIQDGEKFSIKTATIALNNELRERILHNLAQFDQGEWGKINSRLRALPSGADEKEIARTIGSDSHWIDSHVENYHRALTYLKIKSQKGFIESIEVDNAKRILWTDAGSFDPGSPYTGEFQKSVEKNGDGARHLDDVTQKVGVVALQSILTATAVISQNYEAIPFIWTAGPTTATLARAYIENRNVIDAAVEEIKKNQIFGTPGGVIADHLTGKDSPPAWKLFLIDILAMGVFDGAFMKGAKSFAQAKGRITGALSNEVDGFIKGIVPLAKKYAIKITPKETLELAKCLVKADELGKLEKIASDVKEVFKDNKLRTHANRVTHSPYRSPSEIVPVEIQVMPLSQFLSPEIYVELPYSHPAVQRSYEVSGKLSVYRLGDSAHTPIDGIVRDGDKVKIRLRNANIENGAISGQLLMTNEVWTFKGQEVPLALNKKLSASEWKKFCRESLKSELDSSFFLNFNQFAPGTSWKGEPRSFKVEGYDPKTGTVSLVDTDLKIVPSRRGEKAGDIYTDSKGQRYTVIVGRGSENARPDRITVAREVRASLPVGMLGSEFRFLSSTADSFHLLPPLGQPNYLEGWKSTLTSLKGGLNAPNEEILKRVGAKNIKVTKVDPEPFEIHYPQWSWGDVEISPGVTLKVDKDLPGKDEVKENMRMLYEFEYNDSDGHPWIVRKNAGVGVELESAVTHERIFASRIKLEVPTILYNFSIPEGHNIRVFIPSSIHSDGIVPVLAKLREDLGSLPESFLLLIDEINLNDGDSISNVATRSSGHFHSNGKAAASANLGQIDIYSGKAGVLSPNLMETLAHESGHILADAAYSSYTPNKSWLEAMRKDANAGPRSYAQSNLEEDFACAVAEYVRTDGGRLNAESRIKYANRFKLLDQLIIGTDSKQIAALEGGLRLLEFKNGFVVLSKRFSFSVIGGAVTIHFLNRMKDTADMKKK